MWFARLPSSQVFLRDLRSTFGQRRSRHGAAFGLLLACFLFQVSVDAQVQGTRRVLLLTDLGTPASPGFTEIEAALFSELQKSPYKIEFYDESLEVTLFPDEASEPEFREEFLHKFSGHKPDVIVAAGAASLKFIASVHDRFFGDTPVIFCGIVEDPRELLRPDPHFTGVRSEPNPEETLNAVLRLLPETKRVVVVGGMGEFDRRWEAIAKKSFRGYEAKLDFAYLTDLAMPALLEQLKHLPSHTVVYHTSITQDAAGEHFIDSAQSVPLVIGAANAPVFVMDDVDFRAGAVGGDLVNWANNGRIAGNMAVRILNGEKPQDIPIAISQDVYTFDWTAMQRWELKERSLPPGSIVVNRPASFWQLYKRYVLVGIFVILAQMLAIFALLWQRAKRRKTEGELVRSNEQLRLALEAGKCVAWDLDLNSGRTRWFGDLRTMFGMNSETFEGQVEDFYRNVHPEDRARVKEAISKSRQKHEPYYAEFRLLLPNGTIRWVDDRGAHEYASNGEPKRIVGMAVDITERKQVDEALRKSEEKFSKAFRESPLAFALTSTQDHRYIEVNETFERVTGWSRNEIIGRGALDVGIWTNPGQRIEFIKRLLAEGTVRDLEISYRAKNGEARIGLTSAELIEINGEQCSLSAVADITEAKKAEAALRESEERFRHVANAAPVMIWMSGPDKLCTYFNQPWLNFTGRPIHAELGDGWAECVHPDDLEGCLKTYGNAFDQREPFEMEYRLLRHDGEYRWVFDHGVPRFNQDGSFAGYIGSCIDVTERRLAQEALSGMSRKLIEAQEQERTRIARELHDDINQRVALVSVNLERLQRDLISSAPVAGQRFDELREQLSDLGRDIQALSHHLHSSKLEYLGLVTAATGFCKELSEEQGVQVEFHSENIPKQLPWEIALCFYRVLQESLQNALKHSGSRHFEVWLKGTPSEIALTVQDSGVGFDPEEALRGRGLGLTSMKERLKLVHGELFIDAQPGHGVVVRATVPHNCAARAAGV